MKTKTTTQPQASSPTYLRFNLLRRIEHLFMILSFTVLAVTGLPQKFAGTDWAETMMVWMGNIENVRIIHHTAAIVLVLVSIVEVLMIGYKLYVERAQWTIFPRIQDGFDAFNQFLYNLGLRKQAPKYDRYSWGEKFEYWALIWGTVIMALTGFILWNPILATRILPGEFIPVAKAAHGGEAILAVLAVIVWHLYNVHVKTFNRSMFTGKLSAHEMAEEHPLELERLKAEEISQPARDTAKRKRIFFPLAAGVTIVLLGIVYFLTAGETTALTTVIPRVTEQAFVPRTFTPTATRVPTLTRTPEPTTTPVAGATVAPATAAAGAVATIPFLPASHEGRTTCLFCHSNGFEGAPLNPPDHETRLDSSCTSCHKLESESTGASTGTGTGSGAVSAIPAVIPADHEGRTLCLACHSTGYIGSPLVPADHAGRDDTTCQSCHKPE